MKNICFQTKGNGDLCLAVSNDGSGKCGRHGGLSERSMKTIEKMKLAGYEPDGDLIMRKSSKSRKKNIKNKKIGLDSDGDVIMRKRSD